MIDRTFFVFLLLISITVAQKPNTAVGLPLATLQGLVTDALPSASADVAHLNLPPYCCYDDVGEKSVHMNFQNLAIDPKSTSVTATLSAPSSLTIEGCKGDGFFLFNTVGKVDLDIAASSSGSISVTPKDTVVSVSLANSDVCQKIQSNVVNELNSLNSQLNADVVDFITSETASFLNKIEQNINVTSALNITWNALPKTSATTNGVSLYLYTDTINIQSGKKGPFPPASTLPDVSSMISPTSEKAVVLIDQSVFDNIAWVYFDDFTPYVSNSTWNNMTVSVSTWLSPRFTFTAQPSPNNATVSLTVKVDGHDATSGAWRFTGNMTLGLSLDLVVSGQSLFAQVAQNTFDVSIKTVSGPSVSGSDLKQHFSFELLIGIPMINSKLQQNPFSIPSLQYLKLSSPTFVTGNGYLAISDVVAPTVTKGQSRALNRTAAKSPGFTCPPIAGAHQDDCKV